MPIHLQGSCPNRDGTKGTGGCIFCGEEGGSFEWTYGDIRQQFEENRERMRRRYHAEGFIAYFQNFTGTYLPLEQFIANLKALPKDELAGVSISTRPDCAADAYLEAAKSVFPDIPVTFELGLQTVNPKTLSILNRGHTVDAFTEAAARIKRAGIRLCVHMILDLPWDDRQDILDGAALMNAVDADEVKIHNLYVPKGTKLAKMYEDGSFVPVPLDEFIERTILFLEHLRADIVIGRLLGRAPEKDVLFANWDRSWYWIRDEIVRRMEESNRMQGSKVSAEKKGREHDSIHSGR